MKASFPRVEQTDSEEKTERQKLLLTSMSPTTPSPTKASPRVLLLGDKERGTEAETVLGLPVVENHHRPETLPQAIPERPPPLSRRGHSVSFSAEETRRWNRTLARAFVAAGEMGSPEIPVDCSATKALSKASAKTHSSAPATPHFEPLQTFPLSPSVVVNTSPPTFAPRKH